MRRFFADLDSGKLLLAAGTSQELASIDEKRSPNAAFEVQFLRGVTPQELSAGSTGKMEIKQTGDYDANALAAATSWVKTGTGIDTIYTFSIDLMNAALNALLGVNSPSTISAVNTGTETITTSAAHGLSAGNIVQFQAGTTLPAGLSEHTNYYVIAGGLTTIDFRVSLTAGGTAVNLTDAGTGTNLVNRIDNDIVSVDLMAAIEWVADGRTNESQTFVFTLVNDVVRDTDNSTPPTPSDIVLNVRAGKQSITVGTDTGSITFGTPFIADANVDVVLSVSVPDGGTIVWGCVKRESISETGFEYQLSAAITVSGYMINYMAVAI